MIKNMMLDLRLLAVFHAVMAERSVTRASRRLGLSQPAISNALRRLREILDDELFQRTAHGMLPTPRALELASPVGQVLRQLEAALQPASFVAADSDRLFKIAIAPPVNIVLLPALLQRLQTKAKGIRLEVQSTSSLHAAALLDSQAVDVLISVLATIPKRLPTRILYRDRYVGLMRSKHPLARGPLKLADFAAANHLLVTQTNQSYNLFDAAIAREGLKRNLTVTLTDWLTAADIIAHTDLVTAVFEQTAIATERTLGRQLVAKPLPVPPFFVTMHWHEAFSKHPAYEWLHDQIVACCNELGLREGLEKEVLAQ